MRSKQRQGGKCAAKYRDARDNDPPRRKAIEQYPDERRTGGHRQRRQAERSRDGLPGPAEFRRQWLQEDAERIDQQRGKAHEHASRGGECYPPAPIGKAVLVEHGLTVEWLVHRDGLKTSA